MTRDKQGKRLMIDDRVDITMGQFAQEISRLLRPFWAVASFATLLGVVGGLCTAWLLATINTGLHASGGMTTRMIATFVALCLVTLVCNGIAGVGNSMIGQRIIASLRKDISSRIVRAPIAELERYRLHRLLATLNSDVDTVSAFTFNFPHFAVALAVALGCVVYMIMLSPLLFLIAAMAIALGAAVNHYGSSRWVRHYEGVRRAQDDLQKQYRAITEGAKELKINRARRLRVYEGHLSSAADDISDLKIKAMRLFYVTSAAGTTLFFIAIGIILILQDRLGVPAEVVSGFVIVLLYVRGPVETLVGGVPLLGEARVSFHRIAELSSRFKNQETHLLDHTKPARAPEMQSIALQHVTYSFPNAGGDTPFQLGPVDLKIDRGEVLFIVGENGCGKTTLIKLLLGLYSPGTGELLLDGKRIDADQIDAYRQLYSAIFSDYYLFDDLVIDDREMFVRAQKYLEELEISHKVGIEDGRFSTVDLSTGQRKRLALVHAMLEQRPIMMFDEWAADQDPTFRRVFYTVLLPELKRLGKTLIVISHDDRYFSIADRVIRLSQGKVVQSAAGADFGAAVPEPGDVI